MQHRPGPAPIGSARSTSRQTIRRPFAGHLIASLALALLALGGPAAALARPIAPLAPDTASAIDRDGTGATRTPTPVATPVVGPAASVPVGGGAGQPVKFATLGATAPATVTPAPAGSNLAPAASSPAPGAAAPAAAPPGAHVVLYLVEDGDTLGGIADKFGLRASTVLWNNWIEDPHQIRVGQPLILPSIDAAIHLIRPDETLTDLGRRYQTTPDQIGAVNAIGDPALIVAGAQILIPTDRYPESARLSGLIAGRRALAPAGADPYLTGQNAAPALIGDSLKVRVGTVDEIEQVRELPRVRLRAATPFQLAVEPAPVAAVAAAVPPPGELPAGSSAAPALAQPAPDSAVAAVAPTAPAGIPAVVVLSGRAGRTDPPPAASSRPAAVAPAPAVDPPAPAPARVAEEPVAPGPSTARVAEEPAATPPPPPPTAVPTPPAPPTALPSTAEAIEPTPLPPTPTVAPPEPTPDPPTETPGPPTPEVATVQVATETRSGGTSATPAPTRAAQSADPGNVAVVAGEAGSRPAPTPKANAAPAGAIGPAIVAEAVKHVGKPYVWGGNGPSVFDCSGLTRFVYAAVGVAIPRDLAGQLRAGPSVAFKDLAPGDLVFFANTYTAGLSHNGIYIGGGRFLHAQSERVGVVVSSLAEAYWSSRYVGASRPGAR